jgi:hypothetical protein
VWNVIETQWEEGFAVLTRFKNREKHCNVPVAHFEGNFNLGSWVSRQRGNKDNISPQRRTRLDAISFIWEPFEAKWEEGFATLTTYKAREGHCHVPVAHVEGNFKLGTWVDEQRTSRDTMRAARRQQLDAIGFVWNSFQTGWQEGFAALTTYKTREGHCNVPQRHVEGTFKLGQWVNNWRSRQDLMSSERRKLLDDIGFVWRVIGRA